MRRIHTELSCQGVIDEILDYKCRSEVKDPEDLSGRIQDKFGNSSLFSAVGRVIGANTSHILNVDFKKELGVFEPSLDSLTDTRYDEKSQFNIIPVLINFGGPIGHSNVLVLDNRLKTIERFEPNTVPTELERSDTERAIAAAITKFSKIEFPGYRIIPTTEVCPVSGPQIKEGTGTCWLWSLFYVFYRVQCSSEGKTPLQIQRDMTIINRNSHEWLNAFIGKFGCLVEDIGRALHLHEAMYVRLLLNEFYLDILTRIGEGDARDLIAFTEAGGLDSVIEADREVNRLYNLGDTQALLGFASSRDYEWKAAWLHRISTLTDKLSAKQKSKARIKNKLSSDTKEGLSESEIERLELKLSNSERKIQQYTKEIAEVEPMMKRVTALMTTTSTTREASVPLFECFSKLRAGWPEIHSQVIDSFSNPSPILLRRWSRRNPALSGFDGTPLAIAAECERIVQTLGQVLAT